MRKPIINQLLVCALSVSLAGCVGVPMGKAAKPMGAEVTVINRMQITRGHWNWAAQIERPDYTVVMDIYGIEPDLVLIGFVVPIIPIGQWKWLTGIGKENLRIEVTLSFSPKTTTGTFLPDSVHVVANGTEHVPTEIKKSRHCRSAQAEAVDRSMPLTITEELCLWFRFNDLRPPEERFSVIAEGLPTVDYTLEWRIRGVVGTQD